jgi:hypothetical protein
VRRSGTIGWCRCQQAGMATATAPVRNARTSSCPSAVKTSRRKSEPAGRHLEARQFACLPKHCRISVPPNSQQLLQTTHPHGEDQSRSRHQGKPRPFLPSLPAGLAARRTLLVPHLSSPQRVQHPADTPKARGRAGESAPAGAPTDLLVDEPPPPAAACCLPRPHCRTAWLLTPASTMTPSATM